MLDYNASTNVNTAITHGVKKANSGVAVQLLGAMELVVSSIVLGCAAVLAF